MVPDYLALNGVEIINTQRLGDYSTSVGTGMTSFTPCGCEYLRPSDFVDCDTEGDGIDCGIERYTTPAGQPGIEAPAPWYDPDVPESAGFVGLMPLDVSGMEDNPRTRTVSTSVTGGGAAGPSRVGPRTITVTAVVLGAHTAAVSYGLAWLNEALSTCTGGGNSPNCGGACMEMFTACPPAPTPAYTMDSTDFRDRYLRTYRNVVLTEGPKVTERDGTSGVEIPTVEFTLSVGGAWAWTTPQPIPELDLMRIPRDDSDDCVVWCLHTDDEDEKPKPTPPACIEPTSRCPGAGLAVPVAPDGQWAPPKSPQAVPAAVQAGESEERPQAAAPAGYDNPNGYDIKVARTIYRVGRERGVNAKVMLSAFETGIVESRMRNLDYGDRDSVGVFQQRPSQGWGTRKQCMDVVHASNKYFDGAIKSDKDDPDQTAGELAQSVQRSAYPERYDQAQGEAEKLLAHVKQLEEEEEEESKGEESDNEESKGEESEGRESEGEESDGEDATGCVWWPLLTDEERRRLHGDECDKCRWAPCEEDPDCSSPHCAPPTPPVPKGPEGCFCQAMVPVDEIFEVDLSDWPAWFGSTPMIEITSGSDELHNISIEFFERNISHNKLTAEQVIAANRCNPAAVYNVQYAPRESVVTIDGQVNRAWVSCRGVCQPSRDVYGRDGGPITWAELGCDKYVVRVSSDALLPPAEDARITVSLSEREFTKGRGGWGYKSLREWDPCRW